MMRRRVKTILTMLAASAVLVLVLGVTQASAAGPLAGKKVGLLFCTEANPFCNSWIKTFKAQLKAQGAEVTVLTSVFDPAVDAQHMSQFIAQKPDLIVITPADPNAILPSVARAKAAGIKIINAIGRMTPAGQKLITSSVLTDNEALGRFAAQNLVEGMQAAGYTKGNVIELTGTATQFIVQDRVVAFKAELAKHPEYKLVAVEDTNWDQAASAKVTQQLLAKFKAQGGIQGAYGMADNMAVGIVQGAQQAGVKIGVADKGLIVTGSNCLSVGIDAIKAGTMFGTATQAPYSEASAAAKVAIDVLNGKTVAPISKVTEYRITKENVAKFAKLCTF